MSLVESNYQRWLNSDKVSKEEKKELLAMSEESKNDAFFQNISFGTAGMRGIMGPGTNRINNHTIKKVSIGYGLWIKSFGKDACKRGVVISHDNRRNAREYSKLAASILNDMGINAYLFDSLRPTPELSYGVRYVRAAGGIMITASHNSKEYNGFKVYDANGCQLVPEKIEPLLKILDKLPDELEAEVEEAEVKGTTKILSPKVDDDYVKEVESCQMNPDLDKKGFKVVYTPNHGSSLENALRVFRDCGYEIYPVKSQCVHDPDFSAMKNPNPELDEAWEEAIKLAKSVKADIAVMTDPDGDRCGLAYLSSKGTYERLTGNESGALLIDYLFSERKRQGKLHENGVMYDTIVTSDLGRKVAAYYGIKDECFLTGFKFIGDRIAHYEELGKGPVFEFGYEESYGCLIAPFVRDKDGIQAILLYVEMALFYKRKGIPLDIAFDNLQKRFGYHGTKTASLFFEGEEGSKKMKAIMDELHEKPMKELEGIKVTRVEDYAKGIAINSDGKEEKLTLPKSEAVRIFFENGSWVAVRPSGTEPKCKFYCEVVAKEKEGLDEKVDAFISAIKKALVK